MKDKYLVVIDGQDMVFCETLKDAFANCAQAHKEHLCSEIFQSVGELVFETKVKIKKTQR